jgi:hypothetical protein
MAALRAIPPAILACPRCPKCGTEMMLVQIYPAKPGHDRRVYECPGCEHEVTEIIRFRKAS